MCLLCVAFGKREHIYANCRSFPVLQGEQGRRPCRSRSRQQAQEAAQESEEGEGAPRAGQEALACDEDEPGHSEAEGEADAEVPCRRKVSPRCAEQRRGKQEGASLERQCVHCILTALYPAPLHTLRGGGTFSRRESPTDFDLNRGNSSLCKRVQGGLFRLTHPNSRIQLYFWQIWYLKHLKVPKICLLAPFKRSLVSQVVIWYDCGKKRTKYARNTSVILTQNLNSPLVPCICSRKSPGWLFSEQK